MTYAVGHRYVERLVVDEALVNRFAVFSGDDNPLHVDAAAAKAYGYPRCVAHGAILIAAISRIIGTRIPGAGAVWMSQSIQWLKPVFVNDEIELTVEITGMTQAAGLLSLQMDATVGATKVMTGSGQVKVSRRLSGDAHTPDGSARVALVTGGSRGIGAAVARRLSAAGHIVVVNYRSREVDANAVLADIRAASGGSLLQGDLAQPGAGASAVERVLAEHGRLDIIVHAATPPMHRVSVDQASYSDMQIFLATYVGAAMELVGAACPGMAERRFGRVISLGTGYLFGVPPAGLATYVAAKEALWGYTKSIAAELGPKGITANMVSPGMTITDLVSDVPARVKEVEARKSSMRRLANVDDVAGMIVFLAGDDAGYVNGANLPLTGGSI